MANEYPFIGSYFGNYQVTAKIACGSSGCVYRVQHVFLPRVAAIKLLHATRLQSLNARDKFLQEARILERLKHPHILPIYEFGIDDSLPYLVTEYASGGSLRDLLKHRSFQPLPVEEAIALISQIGDALYYAHQQGIIHHDLKPENILFNAGGDALLADFGIAVVRNTVTLEQVIEVNGTPAFMAPEQFRGNVSRRSDQYSLGCILYELVTGRLPFTAPNAISMGLKHMQEHPIPPTRLNPNLPPHIEHAVLKALEKRRINRHPNILIFLQELQGFPAAHIRTSTRNLANSLTLVETKEQHLSEGLQLYSLGRYIEALAAYERALSFDPNFADAYFGKGNTLYFLKRYEEALTAFERAIRLIPRKAAFHSNKGSTLYSLGRLREALTAYEQAIQLDPHLKSAQRGRSLVLRRLGGWR
jgi:serine/threonine protein kinase